MSLYQVQKLMFALNNDTELRERFAREPAAVLDRYDLRGDARTAMENADVAGLYRMGVHPLLLAPFAGRCGLAWPEYLATLAATEAPAR